MGTAEMPFLSATTKRRKAMRGELTLQTTFIGDPGKIKAGEEETRAFYLALLTRILELRRQEVEKQAETDTRREA